MADDIGEPISYLVLPKNTPVFDRSGDTVGTVVHVLKDDKEDVFHGLVLKTDLGYRFAASDQVDGLFSKGVIVAEPASALPEPTEDPSLTGHLKRAWDWIVTPK